MATFAQRAIKFYNDVQLATRRRPIVLKPDRILRKHCLTTHRYCIAWLSLIAVLCYFAVLKGIPTKTETAKKIGENLPFLKVATRVRRPETPFGTGPKSDVVFIIDDSGSISPQDFQTSLSTLGQMITKASPSTKFAAVKYSSTANLLFQFVPPHEAKMLLRGPSHTMGSTNTQAALRMARTELFLNPNAGQCPGGKRIAVLVTDGMSNVHKSQTVPQANLLKSAGVEVFVIAVGQYSESGLQEMVQICSFPYQQHFFRVDSSRSFRDVVSYIPK